MNSDKRTQIFERIPVHKAVLLQIIPAIASQMIALIYNLADTYFVGMLDDSKQIAAITVVSSSFIMLTAFSNLFGVGGASLIARLLGNKNPDKAKEVAGICFWLGLITSIIISILFIFCSRPILIICGATDETLSLALGYAKWIVIIGGPFSILNTLLANLTRAEGSSLHAFIGVSLGGLLNIILDPFFILPNFLGFGVVGAGMATAISNMVAVLYFVLYSMHNKNTILTLYPKYLKNTAEYIIQILSIGFPSALQFGLTVVAVSAQNNFISKYSTEAMAAIGIVKKLDQLPLFFSQGVANGLLPLLAYNYAAGNNKRRKNSFRLGCFISVGFALLSLVVYEIFAPNLAGLFINDTKTVTYGAAFLRRMVIAMPLMAFCYPMIIQFQAMGKVKESLIASILRKGVLDIPLLYMLNASFHLYGCVWVQPIVDSISLIVSIVLYRRLDKKDLTNPPSLKYTNNE